MKKEIENPKIFISYAWSSKEYENKVLSFASRLVEDGIEVLLDKWDIDPGADTVNFMEKCVKDSSVDYVLMLLDKAYCEKADNREGGVGLETQIISYEVYNNVEQNKFIPIIFDKGKNGEVYVPKYLKSRLYFDLTGDEKEDAYANLVKNIYGIEIYKKPELGNKPEWINDQTNTSSLKYKISSTNTFNEALNNIFQGMKECKINDNYNTDRELLEAYSKTHIIRNCLIDAFFKYNSNNCFLDDVLDFYETIIDWNNNNQTIKKEIWNSFIHETFIYLVTVLFKCRKYNDINNLIIKSYYIGRQTMDITRYYYNSGYYYIEKAKNNIDDKNYYSAVAQLWVESVYEPKITKNDLVFGDLLIFNLSILLLDNPWFPVTYIYGPGKYEDSNLCRFSCKLKSVYELKKYSGLFGTDDIIEIKELFDKMIEFADNYHGKYRYSNCFECPEIIFDFIKPSELSTEK